jgi:hypothetical protein
MGVKKTGEALRLHKYQGFIHNLRPFLHHCSIQLWATLHAQNETYRTDRCASLSRFGASVHAAVTFPLTHD